MQVMLAGKYNEKWIKKILPLYGQIKWDGIRVFIKDGYARSRSLKPIRSQQFQSLIAHNKEFLEGLDGEFICGEPTARNCYHRTDSSVMSFNKPDADPRFYVFDQWESVDRFEDRLQELQSLDFSGINFRVELSETKLLWSIDDIDEFTENAISQGHEGIILRNPNSYYKFGRGGAEGELIKRKDGRWIDTECLITGIREQRSNENEATINALGRTERSGHKENLIPAGVVGSFQGVGVWSADDLIHKSLWGKEYEVSVGSGLDDQMRMDYWNDSPVGRMMKFKFFTGGIKDRPRFPVFLGLRDPDDMSPEPEQMSLF